MTYPVYVKEKARQLRVDKRLTIDELAERLAIPRTTLYYWVRDLSIRSGRRTPISVLGSTPGWIAFAPNGRKMTVTGA
jgi:transposase-like protein